MKIAKDMVAALAYELEVEGKIADKAGKEKPGLMKKIWKGIITAITGTLAAMLGTYVSDKITGKKSKSSGSLTGRMAKNATSSVTRTITRDILGNLVK